MDIYKKINPDMQKDVPTFEEFKDIGLGLDLKLRKHSGGRYEFDYKHVKNIKPSKKILKAIETIRKNLMDGGIEAWESDWATPTRVEVGIDSMTRDSIAKVKSIMDGLQKSVKLEWYRFPYPGILQLKFK